MFNADQFLNDAMMKYNSFNTRYGQHLMNELSARYPQITVPEGVDCYYDNQKVDSFIQFLYTLN